MTMRFLRLPLLLVLPAAAVVGALYLTGAFDGVSRAIKTFCGLQEPSHDDLLAAALRKLRDHSTLPNCDGRLNESHATACRQEIARLQIWVNTLPKDDVRAAYQGWLIYYAREVEAAVSAEAEEETGFTKRERERAAEAARVKALAECLPGPPS